MNRRTDEPWADEVSHVFPQHRWDTAAAAHGAFHEVLMPTNGPLARIATGLRHRERALREAGILTALDQVHVSMELPRLRSDVRVLPHGHVYLVSQVAGIPRSDVRWSDALGHQLRDLLGELHTASPGDLPPPREWAGGSSWPELVPGLVSGMAGEVRAAARRAVDQAISATRDHPRALVHGDFGPHNLLWCHDKPVSLIDWDHACIGSVIMDVAPLVGFFGTANLRRVFPRQVVASASAYRSSLPLQVAAAASLIGNEQLCEHAVGNFERRLRTGELDLGR